MRNLRVYLALTAIVLIVFAIWPDLDLALSRSFYELDGGFIGQGRLARFGRDIFRVTPFVVLALYAALWAARRLGRPVRWAPSGRAVVFLVATIAVGPGLIVNLGLKDHWHRPRPIQTQAFNGPSAFMPWYDDAGACRRNCSFVSGEAATGFWMVAPASVLPSPWRGAAILAAFTFGVGAGLLRMAFGGHFPSDVLLGGLVTLIVIEIARRIVWPTPLDRMREALPPRRSQTAAEAAEAALLRAQARAGGDAPEAPSVREDLAFWVGRVTASSPFRARGGVSGGWSRSS